MKIGRIFAITEFIKTLENKEEVNVALNTLTLRMCRVGGADVNSDTCRNCEYLSICRPIHQFLDGIGFERTEIE